MIDVRAEVLCSLGPVISANVSDDYLQGSGVIKTRGSVELKGAFVPAVGTTVNFSWNKPSSTTDLPRELRVLSSTVDPFRLVTRVELGCALTYFTNRKPPTTNLNSKEENDTVPCYVYNYATLPISASYVLEQCATALGLTLSSNPLTNKFSVEEFDLSAGYVQVIGDLLVSEGYFGMVRSGTMLEVFNLLDEGTTGPTITADDIIDLGPVGVGTLPGETARVRYTTRRLKKPDPTDANETLKRRWEAEVSYGAAQETSVTYTDDNGDSVQAIGSYTPYRATYSTYDTWDRLISSLTYELSISSEISPQYAAGFRVMVPVERIQLQKPRYKVAAPAGPMDGFDLYDYLQDNGEQALAAYLAAQADADTGTAADCIASQKPDDYSDVVESVTETYISPLQLAAGLSVDTFLADDGLPVYTSPKATILESRSIVTYDKDPNSGITKTRTEKYQIEGNTIAGQQHLARLANEGYDTSTYANLLSSVDSLIAVASSLKPVAVETLIRTEREYGLQKRPSQSDLNNKGNAKADPVEATEETVWAVGSVETEATQEFSLPYAPDDVIGWTLLGGYTSTPSDAKEKALAYGRIQNRLLLGNRYALSLQIDPGILPDAPFKPVYVQAAGITGQYRVNGCSWAMTRDGVIASTDALYWGAVGADPGASAWVPLPPGMDASDLPATPITPSVVIAPFNETVVRPLTVRAAMEVQKFGYALELLTTAALPVKSQALAARVRLVTVPSADVVTLAAATPRVATGAAVRPGATAIQLAASVPTVSGGASVAAPSSNVAMAALVPQNVGNPATRVFVPAVDITLATLAPVAGYKDSDFSSVSLLLHMEGTNNSTTFTDSSSNALSPTVNGTIVISTAQSKFGSASAYNAATSGYLEYASAALFNFASSAFTVECWIRPDNVSSGTRSIFSARYSGFGLFEVRQSATALSWLIANATLSAWSSTSTSTTGLLAATTWAHIALVGTGSNVDLYVGGTSRLSIAQPSWTSANRPFFIGKSTDGQFVGYVDEVRVTKGVARYTGTFTPPTQPFPDS